MEKISVIIPTYNVERYVRDAITSILNQSYKNLEIIIIDDASTDDTFSILNELKIKDNRIKLYRNSTNKKIAETLNFGLSIAQGEYIARMDGDDISKPNRIEILYKFLKDNPLIDLVGSQTETINEYGDFIGKSKFPIIEENIYIGLKYRMSPIAHIWLARRKVYELIPQYRIPYAEDYDFLLRLKTHNIRFTNVEGYLYQVRLHDKNTTSTNGLKQRYAANYAYKLYKERLKQKTNKDEYSESNYKRFTRPNKLLTKLHAWSNLFLQKSLKNKNNKFYFFLNLTLSLSFSPYYQIQFIYFRYKIKKLE